MIVTSGRLARHLRRSLRMSKQLMTSREARPRTREQTEARPLVGRAPGGAFRRWHERTRERAALSCAIAWSLWSCVPSYKRCPDIPPALTAAAPAQLSETGLYADIAAGVLAEGVVPYKPRYELWSDGATKQRWISLPQGAQINSDDMDAWQFPQGTKLWKEFAVEGARVETRLLEKVGPRPEDWLAIAYVWDARGRDARATPEGQLKARGTQHEVPKAKDCAGCHAGTKSYVLGFSAIQLAHVTPPPATSISVAQLTEAGRLTTIPTGSLALPGDALTQQALGYMHANCAHCHNQHRPASAELRCFDPKKEFDLSLRTDQLASPADTPTYKTAIGEVIDPGDPESSALYKRTRGDLPFFQSRMPSLTTHALDPQVLPLLHAWITALPGR